MLKYGKITEENKKFDALTTFDKSILFEEEFG